MPLCVSANCNVRSPRGCCLSGVNSAWRQFLFLSLHRCLYNLQKWELALIIVEGRERTGQIDISNLEIRVNKKTTACLGFIRIELFIPLHGVKVQHGTNPLQLKCGQLQGPVCYCGDLMFVRFENRARPLRSHLLSPGAAVLKTQIKQLVQVRTRSLHYMTGRGESRKSCL